jgi:hypothetical protein
VNWLLYLLELIGLFNTVSVALMTLKVNSSDYITFSHLLQSSDLRAANLLGIFQTECPLPAISQLASSHVRIYGEPHLESLEDIAGNFPGPARKVWTVRSASAQCEG